MNRGIGKNSLFDRAARCVAHLSGSSGAFFFAAAVIVGWALLGPIFDYSDTWQLVINTGTTIITFLMVFIIQHTQNKDTVAMQVKLDELIRAVDQADNICLDLEELEEHELDEMRQMYLKLAAAARKARDEKETT
ncbi:MAG: low affinity iron permease family protein [Bdellovibrionales bacterium]